MTSTARQEIRSEEDVPKTETMDHESVPLPVSENPICSPTADYEISIIEKILEKALTDERIPRIRDVALISPFSKFFRNPLSQNFGTKDWTSQSFDTFRNQAKIVDAIILHYSLGTMNVSKKTLACALNQVRRGGLLLIIQPIHEITTFEKHFDLIYELTAPDIAELTSAKQLRPILNWRSGFPFFIFTKKMASLHERSTIRYIEEGKSSLLIRIEFWFLRQLLRMFSFKNSPIGSIYVGIFQKL